MKILMVCLGNICRSPMAEGILRDKLKRAGIQASTDSAGTGNYHIGEAPDPRAVATMRRNGHDISDLRARQFEIDDFDRFDKIFVMDLSNKENVVKLARNMDDSAKVQLILDQGSAITGRQVPDPYFGGEAGFQSVYDMLNTACDNIINTLK